MTLTVSCGIAEPEKLTATIATALLNIVNEQDFDPLVGVVQYSNSSLAALEIALAGLIGREAVLRQYS